MNDFWTQFELYARSYLPDWQYQPGGSELEAALMTALGEMLEDSRHRLEHLPEKHLREYLSTWYDALQKEEPGYVYVNLTAPHSMVLPKGTQFYQSGDGTKLWETTMETCVETSKLCEQIVSSGNLGKLVALSVPTKETPSKLFDFHLPGIQQREVRFRHSFAFTSQAGCQVGLNLEHASHTLLSFLCDPACSLWYLELEYETIPLKQPTQINHSLQFHLPSSKNMPASLLVKVVDGKIPPSTSIQRATVETVRTPNEQILLLTEDGPVHSQNYVPFGNKLMQWNLCYVSCPDALTLPGAKVTLSWLQSYQTQEDLLPGMEQKPEYHPIMLHMPQTPPTIRDVWADQVLWEYWDGLTWRIVPGTENCTQMFSNFRETQTVQQEVNILWPLDAQPCMVQGISTHWLRWRLLSCEGFGWLPVRYHVPVLSHISINASLFNEETTVEQLCGVEHSFHRLTSTSKLLFPSITQKQDCWWLGFDTPPSGASFHLYLTLRDHILGGQLTVYEATSHTGARQLSLSDGTNGLSHSGIISLSGFQGQKTIQYGIECWWLCFREESGVFQNGSQKPVLTGLFCGAVLLRAMQVGDCVAGESFMPLQGGTISGYAVSDCFGGVLQESDSEVQCRLLGERHHLDRIVSATDAEQLICTHIRNVVQVCCVPNKTVLQIGILMRDVRHHEVSFQQQKPVIEQLIKVKSALLTLGMDMEVREPSFYPIHVMVWIELHNGSEFSDVKYQIEQILNQFFHPVIGNFGGTGWRMGELPTLEQIRIFLQSAIPNIFLTELVISTTTPDGTEQNPVSVYDPFALPIEGTYTIYTIEKGGMQYDTHRLKYNQSKGPL